MDVVLNNTENENLFLLYTRIKQRRISLEFELKKAKQKAEKAIKKWQHLVKLQSKIKKKPLIYRKKIIRQRSGPILESSFDIYKATGLLKNEFLKIYKLVKEDINKPRNGKKKCLYANSLVLPARLMLILSYLRKGQNYNFQSEWKVSNSYLSREVRFIIPILAARCNFIKKPDIWENFIFENVVGAIDCSSHFRVRVHPHQHDYYRGDKRGFFLSAQIVCSLTGEIYDVTIFPGRVNDQMAFNQTWQQLLTQKNIKLLADGGYSDINLITPKRKIQNINDKVWNNIQMSFRSVVEHVNSVVHFFKYGSTKIRGHEPELQAYCLKVIYNLAAQTLDIFPLRNDFFLYSQVFQK